MLKDGFKELSYRRNMFQTKESNNLFRSCCSLKKSAITTTEKLKKSPQETKVLILNKINNSAKLLMVLITCLPTPL